MGVTLEAVGQLTREEVVSLVVVELDETVFGVLGCEAD